MLLEDMGNLKFWRVLFLQPSQERTPVQAEETWRQKSRVEDEILDALQQCLGHQSFLDIGKHPFPPPRNVLCLLRLGQNSWPLLGSYDMRPVSAVSGQWPFRRDSSKQTQMLISVYLEHVAINVHLREDLACFAKGSEQETICFAAFLNAFEKLMGGNGTKMNQLKTNKCKSEKSVANECLHQQCSKASRERMWGSLNHLRIARAQQHLCKAGPSLPDRTYQY